MKEQLTELQERVSSARAALEALAERAAELRGRVEAGRMEEGGPPALPAVRAREDSLLGYRGITRDPFMPIGPDGGFASALDRLSHGARPIVSTPAERGDGDDGGLLSDAWEIALINEEGK
jgi:hypothetical protein